MAQRFQEISEELQQFIEQQKMFFVATATADGRINLSPKGVSSLKVVSPIRVIWLNLTGSGNETAAHIQEASRMTIMFCSFEGAPLILRLYGQARVIHNKEPEWTELLKQFPPISGARQIFDLSVELVQTSCGAGVPLYDYVDDRDELTNWLTDKGESGVRDYWQQKNRLTIDGNPTYIMEKSG